MNCVCGCGVKLKLSEADANLLAADVALELAAWDRARALGSSVEAAAVAAQIESGTPIYPELLRVVHREREPKPVEAVAQSWLASSRAARKRVNAKLPAVPKNKVNFSNEEMARVDRHHPELTFSGVGGGAMAGMPGAHPPPSAADDLPSGAPTALELELGAVLAGARDGAADFERLAVDWLGRLVFAESPSLDELRWLLGRLEDARSGRIEEAEPALRRFLAERS